MIVSTSAWPAAVVVAIVVIGAAGILMTYMGVRGGVAAEETKGKLASQYRELLGSYEKLAQETKDLQAAMQADLAGLRQKVESIEHMMREVA
jgi:hypothetical protein